MYLSYQIQRMLAAETMTAAERREADEQAGKLAADLAWLIQRARERASGLSRPVLAAWQAASTFRNLHREMHSSDLNGDWQPDREQARGRCEKPVGSLCP